MNKKEEIQSLKYKVADSEEKINEIIKETKELFEKIGHTFHVRKLSEKYRFSFMNLPSLDDCRNQYDKQPVSRKRIKALEEYLKIRYIKEEKSNFYQKVKDK